MSINFLLKDFFRGKNQTLPHIFVLIIMIATDIFQVNCNFLIGLKIYPLGNYSQFQNNPYFFTGTINLIYSQLSLLNLYLMHLLTIIVIWVIITSFLAYKKRDIAIMRAIGGVPNNLYGFFMKEIFLLFLIGYIMGFFLGIFFTLIFFIWGSIITGSFNLSFDFLHNLIFFFIYMVSVFLIAGKKLKKIGNEPLTKNFSSDLPLSLNVTAKLKFLLNFLSALSLKFKISIINVLRKKKEYQRNFLFFSLIFSLLFTLGLNILIIRESSHQWINNAQGTNVLIIGHEDVLYHYSLMYEMFSDPRIFIDENNIDFLNEDYIFSRNQIQALENIKGILSIEDRLISFCEVKELKGLIVDDNGEYMTIGENRQGIIPIIGIEQDSLIKNSEIEGKWGENDYMVIGDGLASNFFEYPLNQSIYVKSLQEIFHISGVIIDSFYNGHVGYISLKEYQEHLKLRQDLVNLVLLSCDPISWGDDFDLLRSIITKNLGEEFTFLSLDFAFKKNHDFLDSLAVYPFFLFFFISLNVFLSIYNYQRGALQGNLKDFILIKMLGAKMKTLKQILFLESFYAFFPALILGLSLSMIATPLFLHDRAYLPGLIFPISLFFISFIMMLIFIGFSIRVLFKKLSEALFLNR
ncbi:MAG: FtsX-like permease family protein [Promethearchaeota archaeon]